MNGTVAKINLALSELPRFTDLDGSTDALTGRIHVGPDIDYLERAFDESKYGDFSRAPYLEIAIPSLSDSPLSPAGQHVMSLYIQSAPYNLKNRRWRDEAHQAGLLATGIQTNFPYAPR